MRYRYRRRPWICRVPDWQLQAFGILFALFFVLLNAIPKYIVLFQRYLAP